MTRPLKTKTGWMETGSLQAVYPQLIFTKRTWWWTSAGNELLNILQNIFFSVASFIAHRKVLLGYVTSTVRVVRCRNRSVWWLHLPLWFLTEGEPGDLRLGPWRCDPKRRHREDLPGLRRWGEPAEALGRHVVQPAAPGGSVAQPAVVRADQLHADAEEEDPASQQTSPVMAKLTAEVQRLQTFPYPPMGGKW